MTIIDLFELVLFGVPAILFIRALVQRHKAYTTPEQPTGSHNEIGAKTYSLDYLLQLMEVKRQAEARGDKSLVRAILDMTYDGPLPARKPDGTFTMYDSEIIDYSIAGINYRDGIDKYVGTDFTGYLVPEPTNDYDPDAIAVHHSDGHHLGYIPSGHTSDVRALSIPFPVPIWGHIDEGYDDDEDHHYFYGTIHIERPNVSPYNS